MRSSVDPVQILSSVFELDQRKTFSGKHKLPNIPRQEATAILVYKFNIGPRPKVSDGAKMDTSWRNYNLSICLSVCLSVMSHVMSVTSLTCTSWHMGHLEPGPTRVNLETLAEGEQQQGEEQGADPYT